MREHPPYLNAGNAGPFTLDGTRTFLVGDSELAILDPGPDVESHVRALVRRAAAARRARVVLTHGHGDHAACARRVADEAGADVWGPEGLDVDVVVRDGASVPTDDGELVAVHTPGHTRDHLCYHWPERSALFVGDLLLGEGDTTWVAEYPGCVADYLASLERVRALAVDVLYPAHGPPLEDVDEALERYERHRRDRIGQARDALRAHPEASSEGLLRVVYGRDLPVGVRSAALQSLEALLEYVRGS